MRPANDNRTQPALTKLTRGQRQFLTDIFDGRHVIAHRRVVRPLFDAGFIWPVQGNFLFWVVGCNGHATSGFVLLRDGFDALTGQLQLSPVLRAA